MGLFSFFKKAGDSLLFPDKTKVLDASLVKYDNFFPVASLDLSAKGISIPIHVVYVSFDPAIDDSTLFIKPDYIDEFTFDIMDDGKLKPTFNKKALTITNGFIKYFKEGQAKYRKAKKEMKSIYELVDFPDEPEWWQYDQTPKNSKGDNYKFICQLDMYEVVDDDCRMFIFYDENEKKIKCVYQRT